MCISVERAHVHLLRRQMETCVRRIVRAVNKKADPFLSLDDQYASETIFYRDFPKAHVALRNHPGGLSIIEKRFPFVSGCEVHVDNFFVGGNGKIHLIEPRRQYSKVRVDSAEAAMRKLNGVAEKNSERGC
jgi:hypothetical protein